MKSITLPKKPNILISIILLVIIFLVFVYIAYTFLPVHENANPPVTWGWGVDWKDNIRSASIDLISGKTPYTSTIRCFPPWVYLLVSPIAAFPKDLGAAILFALTYLGYAFVLYRLKAAPWVISAFLLNRFTFINAQNGNLDFLAVLGFAFPAQIGLFFVLIKPQIGAGIALFWLIEAWRKGKFREVIRVFAPVTAAYLLSFLIYGLWPLKVMGMTNDPYNASLWPFGIIIGVLMLYKAIRDRNHLFAMGAAPFLSPYVNITSYAVALFPFIPYSLLMLFAAILSWLVVF